MIAADEFRRSFAEVERLLEADRHDDALLAVERMLKTWPGNPRLKTMCASLIQLEESLGRPLDDAKRELLEAVELDADSPAARIELAHYLDSVEDDPAAAKDEFSIAIEAARRLLKEALRGRIEALLQLGRADEASGDLELLLTLAERETSEESRAEAPAANLDLLRLLLNRRKQGRNLDPTIADLAARVLAAE